MNCTAPVDPALTQLYQTLASSRHVGVDPEFGKDLLDCYFSYQVFNTIDRSAFMRDMALGGTCFSDFLLVAIYSCGIRMIDGLEPDERQAHSERFAQSSKELLAQELDGSSKIATVQGLLLLSWRECAVGEVSKGWTHTGLVGATANRKRNKRLKVTSQAFRLIHDVGVGQDATFPTHCLSSEFILRRTQSRGSRAFHPRRNIFAKGYSGRLLYGTSTLQT